MQEPWPRSLGWLGRALDQQVGPKQSGASVKVPQAMTMHIGGEQQPRALSSNRGAERSPTQFICCLHPVVPGIH